MFEICKAKWEAKKAKKEAIIAMDKYISFLSAKLATDISSEERKEIEDEISKLVSIKEVYRKNPEMAKWKSDFISAIFKIAVLAASVGACEIITNRGTGDKIVIDAMKKFPGI